MMIGMSSWLDQLSNIINQTISQTSKNVQGFIRTSYRNIYEVGLDFRCNLRFVNQSTHWVVAKKNITIGNSNNLVR